ncbi:hypothetical protein RJ492_004111 [Pluralibacter gergoviae]|uniref:Ead/Ea22-like family protein n=1 Tax=Pluralibacter gergoviae TaxID=61647 RepID=A0AAI9GKS3_PLUGE|nr:hypothetical protein [Pluralibacter gergoviae]EKV9910093.1 hypothetical protein [Pluralibacter gergoviae]EKW7274998.1 hypothetical protein [Pluralibacter gergoviae]ELD4297398.1 hypothetical protein [Pluralibacter gergoviae]ELD4308145.1 hypothetical protein [Pluralibacter gergoviae]
MKTKIYTVAHPEELSPPLTNQGFCVDVVLASDYAELERELRTYEAAASNLGAKVAALAAENSALNKFIYNSCYVWAGENASWHQAIDHAPETPATDAAIVELRSEGINFAASRLAAAFNHGFVEKPMAEVFDVVRMILTAKEDLANGPAADGLSGEYAEQALLDWEKQLRAEASE